MGLLRLLWYKYASAMGIGALHNIQKLRSYGCARVFYDQGSLLLNVVQDRTQNLQRSIRVGLRTPMMMIVA